MRKALDAGIVFLYGLVLDIVRRRVADLRNELEFVLSRPDIPLPAYVSLLIPMLGTPLFYECLNKGLLLPRTRVRDLDGSTLLLQPLDSMEDVGRFIREGKSFREYRQHAIRHAIGFVRRYWSVFSKDQMVLALSSNALLCAPSLSSRPRGWNLRRSVRTYISTTDVLDHLYRPAFRVDSRYEHYFKPTMLTDAMGGLVESVAGDLSGPERAGSIGERRILQPGCSEGL
jgi:hypothetical protein